MLTSMFPSPLQRQSRTLTTSRDLSMSVLQELIQIRRALDFELNGLVNKKLNLSVLMWRLCGPLTWLICFIKIQLYLQSGACRWRCLTEWIGKLMVWMHKYSQFMWLMLHLVSLIAWRWKKPSGRATTLVDPILTTTKKSTKCSLISLKSNRILPSWN